MKLCFFFFFSLVWIEQDESCWVKVFRKDFVIHVYISVTPGTLGAKLGARVRMNLFSVTDYKARCHDTTQPSPGFSILGNIRYKRIIRSNQSHLTPCILFYTLVFNPMPLYSIIYPCILSYNLVFYSIPLFSILYPYSLSYTLLFYPIP